MKKILFCLMTIFTMVFAGCKTTPSTATLYSTSYSIGVSAALVMNQTKIDDANRNIIIDIVNMVKTSVPAEGSTFTATWMPIASEYVGQLVSEGKMDEIQGQITLTAFNTAVKTLDYVIYKRYPKIGENVNYVNAVASGFTSGFLTYFTPANTVATVSSDVVYDAEAYEYMLQLTK